MITPAISVWISSSAENIVNKSRSLLQPRSKLDVILRRPLALASGRLEGWKRGRSLCPPCETLGVARGAPQGAVEFVSRRGARVFDDDLGGLPVLEDRRDH